MSQISKKFLQNNSVDQNKIKLDNNGAIKSRNAANSADVDLIKLNASDEAQLSTDLNAGANDIINVGNVDGRDVSADGAALDSHLDGGASKHDATEVDYERADGSKVDIQAASDSAESALTDLDDRKLSRNGANAMAANLAMGSFRITGLADGIAAQDAATVKQVQEAQAGINMKDAVRAASTANLTLSGTQTVDGIALVANDRVLAKNQSSAVNNGIYIVAAGAWSRASDFDGSPTIEVKGGNLIYVQEGTVNSNTQFILQGNADSKVVGTDPLNFTIFSRVEAIIAGDGLDRTGTQMDVVVSDLAGSGLEDDGSNNLRIASSAAGDGLQGGSGSALSLKLKANAGLKIDATELAVEPSHIAGSGLQDDGSDKLTLRLQSAGGLKLVSNELTIEASDIAGSGLEDDGSDNLRIAASAAGNGLQGGAGSPLSVKAGDSGAANLADVISVESQGLSVRVDESTIEENGSSQLRVKDAGITEAKLHSGVDANTFLALHTAVNYTPTNTKIDGHLAGIDAALASVAPAMNKESFTLNSTDITNQYVDLANVALANSIDLQPVGGIVQLEGVDYSVNLTGGAGGNTRISFTGDLATGGNAALVSGDILKIKYMY